MKKMLSFVLALVVCVSLSATSFVSASPVAQLPTDRVWNGPSLDPDIVPYSASSVYWFQNDTIWNGKATNSFPYRLDEDCQYAKIWVKNTSGASIHFWNSYNGEDFETSYTVPDKGTKTIYVAGNGNTGAFYLNMRTDTGVALDGQITILTGTKNGVGYPW